MNEDIIAKNLLMNHVCNQCKHHKAVYETDDQNVPWTGRIECARTKKPKAVRGDFTCENFEQGSIVEAVIRAADMIYDGLWGHRKHTSK
jgi:hypothetical protein